MTSQLVKWYSKNKADNFEMVMVSGDRTEAKMLQYMKGKKIKFPALKLKDVQIAKDLGFKGYPWIIMVDEDGKQVHNGVAFSALKDLEKILKK